MHIQELILPPEKAFQKEVEDHLKDKLGLKKEENIRIVKRSIDARSREVKVRFQVEVYGKEALPPLLAYELDKVPVFKEGKSAVVIGAGPAGLFAALRLLELGIKPIVLERGKDVRARRRRQGLVRGGPH